jgi:hypothetical protein
MRGKVVSILTPRRAGGSIGILLALTAGIAWSQIPTPSIPATPATPAIPETPAAPETPATPATPALPATPATPAPLPDAVKDATEAAQDAAKDATNTAQEAIKDAGKTAKDATKSAQETAKDTADTARDAAKDVQRDAKDAAQDATDATRDAAKDVQRSAKDAAQDATDATRDAARDLQGKARDAARDARDTARDVQGTARDAARDLRGTARDAVRDARGAARSAADYRAADLGLWFDRSARNELIIADVTANAALGRFGFMEGDRIVSVGGQRVATEADFVRYFVNANARGPMNVIVLRDGQQQVIAVDPVVLRTEMNTSVQVDPLEQFGIILDDRVSDRLVIWRVIPRSPAFYAGLRAGDVITLFGGRRIADANALVQIVQSNPGVIPIQVTRNGRTRLIEADLQGQVYTSARQNLDVDANIRTNDTTIRADANADVTLPADAPPAIETRRPATRSNYYQPQRRGLFRRGRY